MKTTNQFQNRQLELLLLNLTYLVNEGEIDTDEIEHDVEVYVRTQTGIQLSVSPEHTKMIKEKLKGMRDITSHTLKSIINSFNKQIESIDDMKKDFKDIQDFRSKYPFYVKIKHPKESIKFFDKLDKEEVEYTYSKAGELLGLTRQTIGTYVKNETHGFRNTGKKRVTKQEVYIYFLENKTKK
jgi:predicted transcriptional regulator